ncbi:metalloregulator ArsR/SmtB family transcription factor [Asticcacaulis sp. BYS171W]|uniref:Metalloregulator ArsR/SmtB family transcription factor n=1 Tax=Asticcacaulis aquaticus TaxID=2984212 RepID=A0ABT5HT83_9CAUL|nr:metalloregulator ArsR/SmtB family transcription factor [Asticcacaulis aquaticus]MDC7683199.1 metalloregulator ArsR/SmtB family transcription factor [Asticcacaulis aquaticus]
MELDDAVVALFALAHPGRLEVFRTIVRAGPGGMPAGDVAKAIKAPANTTSTHLSILTGAGLLSAYRQGRSIIYSAQLPHLSSLAAYLLEDCAQGAPEAYSQLTRLPTGKKPA